jgi:hypothetical protein
MRRSRVLGAVLAAGTILLQVLGPHDGHGASFWSAVPGLDLAFGFLGAALLAAVAKGLGGLGLRRDESFYPEDE